MVGRSMTAVGIVAALLMAATPALAQKGKGKKGKGKKGKAAEVEETAPTEELDPESIEDSKEKAKAYYKRGKKKYDEGDFAGALEDFMGAYNTLPNPGVYISIANCYEKLGNFQEAVNYLEKYLEEKPDAGNVPSIEEKVEELKAKPGKVKITSEPPGATITLNGEPTDLVTPADMELPGGDHALALNLEGYIMETRAFTVPIGGAVVVDVPLTGTAAAAAVDLPLPDEDVEIDFDEEEPAEKEQKVGPGVWAMVGVTGAGLVSSTVFGLLALSEQADFDNNPSKSKKDRGEAFALACDISIGVTAAAAITGVVLYLVGAKKERKEREAAEEAVETFDEPAEDAPPVENASIYPIISPDMAGAGFGFDF